MITLFSVVSNRQRLLVPILIGVLLAGPAAADGAPPGAGQTVLKQLPKIEGPEAPLAPAMINRDSQGKATMRAMRIAEPINLDGHLDDAVYSAIPAVTDFIQQFPHAGQPAT